MSIYDRAIEEMTDRMDSDDTSADTVRMGGATATAVGERDATVEVAGEQVPLEEIDTVKSDDGTGSWLSGGNAYGRPRGVDAIEAAQIVGTSAMQAIGNGIVDQLLGGKLVFDSDDDTIDSTEAELRALIEDVLTGPHLGGVDLDDLITGAIFQMLGPGHAYWQLHGPAPDSGVDLPVVTLSGLDALTIRHNTDRNGAPMDPPYYQAMNAFSAGGVGNLGNMDPVELQRDDLAVMHYPRGHRFNSFYPKSPSMQVKEWLETLANSTTHHNRFYSDNEVPPGLLQIIQGSDSTVDTVKDKLEAASGDPRDVPVIGGEGGAQWLDLGGTSVNLNIIEEQRWFFQLCLASLGLGKQELGFIEDVNRSNGEVEATRVFKRITGPFAKQFESAFEHIARRFDVYNALDQPFNITIQFTDPREEHGRQERLRKQYQSGLLTYNEFQQAKGNDPSELDTTVEVLPDVEIDYGDKPKPIVESVLIARRAAATGDDGDGAEAMAKAFDPPEDLDGE